MGDAARSLRYWARKWRTALVASTVALHWLMRLEPGGIGSTT